MKKGKSPIRPGSAERKNTGEVSSLKLQVASGNAERKNTAHVSSWNVFGIGKKHSGCFQLERFRVWEKTLLMFPAGTFSGLGKNTAHVSSPDLGERQTRLRFFLSPWTPALFHAEGPNWLGKSRSTEASGGWVVPRYRSVRWLGSFRLRLLRGLPAEERRRKAA